MSICPPALTVRLYRELDFVAADRLTWPEWADLEKVCVLFIDLRGLTFCDGAGLAAVQRLCEGAESRGLGVQLRGVSPIIRKLARITGTAEKWVLGG